MMKSKKLLLSVLIFSIVFPSTIFAYTTYGYKLINGVYDRKFTVPSNANYTYNGTTIDYGALMRQAVANWNAAVDPGCC
jgi:hypothetical protein